MPIRVLRPTMRGDDITRWQAFLRGQDVYHGEIDGQFGPETLEATKRWQRREGLLDDGIVGVKTLGRAQQLGFNPGVEDDDASEHSIAWPPAPAFPPLDGEGRKRMFGEFQFVPAPVAESKEAIRILGSWVQDNIQRVEIPQLARFPNSHGGSIQLHRLAVEPFRQFFDAVHRAGLLSKVLSFNGSWVPRFIRGSTTELSNHAYGTAIDLNLAWNKLGHVPPLKGEEGSLRELVPIANEFGIYWGGHFRGRVDGMHFELARV
ncbi:MAG: M15 family metallopeptidase [Myxococcales bacterium]